MTVEYLGEKIFREEIEASGQIWVARSIHNGIYTMERYRTGFSLPVWSSIEKVIDFLKNARLIGPEHEPHAVSLEVFKDRWLSNKSMTITELLLNPDGKTRRMLALYPEELQATQTTNQADS